MKKNTNLLKEIQEALGKYPTTRNYLDNVYVLVNDGAVILSGSVPEESLRTQACAAVSHVHGVELVINDLKVEPSSDHRVGVQIDWANGSMELR